MAENFEGSGEVPSVLNVLPGPIKDVGARALDFLRDSFSSQYHLDKILDQDEAERLNYAEQVRHVDDFMGNSSAALFQNKTIVRILALNLARKLQKDNEPVEDRILQLKQTIYELPEDTDLDSLGLPAEVMDIVRPYT